MRSTRTTSLLRATWRTAQRAMPPSEGLLSARLLSVGWIGRGIGVRGLGALRLALHPVARAHLVHCRPGRGGRAVMPRDRAAGRRRPSWSPLLLLLLLLLRRVLRRVLLLLLVVLPLALLVLLLLAAARAHVAAEARGASADPSGARRRRV